MAASLTISFSQFQPLIFIFPTLLFYISLMARAIVTFSKANDPFQTVVENAQKVVTDFLKGKQQNSNSTLLDSLFDSMKEASKDNQNNQHSTIVTETLNRRNKHFLFGVFIDSIALSFANGVIIMFESGNLLIGFVFLFIGAMVGMIGLATIYAGSTSGAILEAIILICAIFLAEIIYLITSNSSWLYMIPIYFTIVFTVIVVLAVVIPRIKARRSNKQKAEAQENVPNKENSG